MLARREPSAIGQKSSAIANIQHKVYLELQVQQ